MANNNNNNVDSDGSTLSMQKSYNLRSPAVKRILRETKELKDATYEYYARPLDDNIFEWHFTVRGATDSDFSHGFYHGRIILPSEYPMKPPSIIMLTPNGRFELNQKICLSISGHHPETWMPSWSIRTVLLAIISFMPTHAEGHIGSLNYTPEERRRLAWKSHQWKCDSCGLIKHHLKKSKKKDHSTKDQQDTKTIPFFCSSQNNDSIGNHMQESVRNTNQNQHRNDANEQENNQHEIINQPIIEQSMEVSNSTRNGSSSSTLIIFYYSIMFIITVLLMRRLIGYFIMQNASNLGTNQDFMVDVDPNLQQHYRLEI